MSLDINFLSAGSSEEEAFKFLCDFIAKIFLDIDPKKDSAINLRCNDASQANEIDKLLWENPQNTFISHKLANKDDLPSCFLEISYPGIKAKNKFSTLVNLNPKLPPDYQDYASVFQLVIQDNSTYQNLARESFKKCKMDGINPIYHK
tara:strand:- start:10205 stop:10648 length:444 start_codon:yes stop_codon:yes gene_type:complete